MKKGVVLSVNKFSITLLTPNGEFDKSRRLNRNYEIGEEINYQPIENPLKSFLYIPGKQITVISAVVTCILFFSIWNPRFSTHVSAYMTIDVNPSIELGLDDELQVIEMKGINADGKRVISKINEWKNKNVSDVAEEIVLKEKELGYINDTHRKIIVSKTMIEDDKELDQKLNQEIIGITKDITIPKTEVKLIQATERDRNKAEQQGISTGKFIEYKLNEEKRKKKELDLEKKKDQPSKNTTNSCVRNNKSSKKVDSRVNYNSKNVYHLNQHVTAHKYHTSVKVNDKVHHSENKGHFENKRNVKIKKNSGNKEKAMVRISAANRKSLIIKSNQRNKGKSIGKSNQGNKGKSMGKSNQENKRKSSSNRWNSKMKGNPGHSGFKGNPGIIGVFIKDKQAISIK